MSNELEHEPGTGTGIGDDVVDVVVIGTIDEEVRSATRETASQALSTEILHLVFVQRLYRGDVFIDDEGDRYTVLDKIDNGAYLRFIVRSVKGVDLVWPPNDVAYWGDTVRMVVK